MNDKTNISIIGEMNVGKSTLFNLITMQKNKAIVDSKAGTTCDNVVNLMEIHEIGKVRITDTPGINEKGRLGDLKRKKTELAINSSDLVIFVRNDLNKKNSSFEENFLLYLKKFNKKFVFLENIKNNKSCICNTANNLELSTSLIGKNAFSEVLNFIKSNISFNTFDISLFGNLKLSHKYVLLIIPLDEESPSLRLLKPQTLIIERLLNDFVIPIIYRPNTKNFNSLELISILQNHKISLIISDSSITSLLATFIPNNILWTSFSIIMSNFQSNGNISTLLNGVYALKTLKDNDNILIVEICNHDRKCNDISTIQLPNIIHSKFSKNILINHHFGKTFLTEKELQKGNYKLIIMCGGCMTNYQEYTARINIAKFLNIPITNYGMVFAYTTNEEVLRRMDIFN